MLPLGSVNIFLDKNAESKFAIPKILDFYDLIGKNFAFFHPQSSKIKWGIKSKKVLYQKKEEIANKILENIFNLDLIVVEGDFYSISDIRKITSLPIIIIKKDHTKFWGDIDMIYDFLANKSKPWIVSSGSNVASINSKAIFSQNDYIVQDVKSGWKASIDDLIKEWKRNHKIDQILGD